jgi:hypothetical protein
MSFDLTITYADGSTEKVHHSIGVWESGNASFKINIKTTKKATKAVLGSTYVPDKNKSDNTFIVQ